MSVDENILCFNIAMHDIEVVKIKKGFCNYKQKLFSLRFRESVVWFREEVVIQRIGPAIL
jgi:hypothetical protein